MGVETRSGCLRPSASVRQRAVPQGVGAETVRSTSFSLRRPGARPGGGTRSCVCKNAVRVPAAQCVSTSVGSASKCWAWNCTEHKLQPAEPRVAVRRSTRGCVCKNAVRVPAAQCVSTSEGSASKCWAWNCTEHKLQPAEPWGRGREGALVAAFVKTRSGSLRPSASVRQRAVRQSVGPGTVRSTSFSLRSPGGAVRRSTRSCVCKNAVRVPAAQCVSTSEGSASRCWAWNCTEYKLQPAEPWGRGQEEHSWLRL